MKRFVNALFIAFLVLGFSCTSKSGKEQKEETKTEVTQDVDATTVKLTVSGMTCTGCENTLQTNLSKIKGVQSVEASHESGKVVVKIAKTEFLEENAPQLDLAKAVESSGYSVDAIEVVKIN